MRLASALRTPDALRWLITTVAMVPSWRARLALAGRDASATSTDRSSEGSSTSRMRAIGARSGVRSFFATSDALGTET